MHHLSRTTRDEFAQLVETASPPAYNTGIFFGSDCRTTTFVVLQSGQPWHVFLSPTRRLRMYLQTKLMAPKPLMDFLNFLSLI